MEEEIKMERTIANAIEKGKIRVKEKIAEMHQTKARPRTYDG